MGLGRMYLRSRKPRRALPLFEAAVALAPDDRWAHIHLGWSHGLIGDLPRGWSEIACFHRLGPQRRSYDRPTWDGSRLDGRTVLLWSNAGLGDAIQMLRYVPLIPARGGRVAIECQSNLISLVEGVEGVDVAIPAGAPLPDFDLQAPLSLLPCLFPTTVQHIPGPMPYLRVAPLLVQHWRQRLHAGGRTRMVGLVWSGEPRNPEARQRFAPLAALSPLGGVHDVTYVSLQLGPGATELLTPPPGLRIRQILDEACPIHETAAVLMNLDLVITVDTMIAHLAGALARPVWTMLPYAADWRWLKGPHSPWYPSMRLFRQLRRGDWDSVVRRVRSALETTEWPIPAR
jgi:hypothetical protein